MWFTFRCLSPLGQSEITVIPSLSLILLGQGTTNMRLVYEQMPQNTRSPSTNLPQLYFYFPNIDLLISAVKSGPPIFCALWWIFSITAHVHSSRPWLSKNYIINLLYCSRVSEADNLLLVPLNLGCMTDWLTKMVAEKNCDFLLIESRLCKCCN